LTALTEDWSVAIGPDCGATLDALLGNLPDKQTEALLQRWQNGTTLGDDDLGESIIRGSIPRLPQRSSGKWSDPAKACKHRCRTGYDVSSQHPHPTTSRLNGPTMNKILNCGLTIAFCAGTLSTQAADSISLFNGKNLDGWTQKGGEASYVVQDGVLLGSSRPSTPNSFLCPEKQFADFELTFETKCDSELNSGVQIRSADGVAMLPESLSEEDRKKAVRRVESISLTGPQVEIAANGNAGGVYFEGVGGWLIDPKPEVAKEVYKVDDWNSYKVVAKGNRIQVWINGEQVIDGEDTRSHFKKGYLGFQVHGVGKREGELQVRWRNIKIREL